MSTIDPKLTRLGSAIKVDLHYINTTILTIIRIWLIKGSHTLRHQISARAICPFPNLPTIHLPIHPMHTVQTMHPSLMNLHEVPSKHILQSLTYPSTNAASFSQAVYLCSVTKCSRLLANKIKLYWPSASQYCPIKWSSWTGVSIEKRGYLACFIAAKCTIFSKKQQGKHFHCGYNLV